MAKHLLSGDDLAVVKQFNTIYEAILTTVERAKQFKLNDYLILRISEPNGALSIQTNSYGAPIKYKVVHVTDLGIAFVKRTGKKGEPTGRIYSCCGTEGDNYRKMAQNFQFELDPDYADSLLLQDGYDPAQLHKSKQDIWKAVTEHNKAARVDTTTVNECYKYLLSVKVGDTLWVSHTGFLLVQDKKTMTAAEYNVVAKWKDRTRARTHSVLVVTVRDKNGKIRNVIPDLFWGKALYKERPRTYKELNI